MLRAVLVVDDAGSGRQVIKHHLEHLGVQDITLACDGREALNLIQSQPTRFKFIFTDLHMPNMDGMQLLSELGDCQYNGQVVVFSKLDLNVIKLSVQLAREKKVRLAGFLAKPIEEKAMLATIEKLEKNKFSHTNVKHLLKRRQLIEAIEHRKIIPYFQPKIEAGSKIVTGFELLCRLELADEQNLILPERFVQVADKFNLITPLFECLLDVASLPIKQILAEFPDNYDLTFSINVSPKQLRDDALPDRLMTYCKKMGLANNRLIVEVTEHDLIQEFEMLMTLERLRIHGFGLSLDDFGTGFTNLADLCRLPFTEIKLDQSFVQDISTDKLSQVILKSLGDITKELGIRLIAEGIENNRDFTYVTEHTFADIQGHLVSRPKPVAEVIRWLMAWNHNWNIGPSAYLTENSP